MNLSRKRIQNMENFSIIVSNSKKLNSDGLVSFDALLELGNLSLFDDLSGPELIEALNDHQEEPVVIIIKELILTREIINLLPGNVKLIVEAKSRYDNIDVQAAKERGPLCQRADERRQSRE